MRARAARHRLGSRLSLRWVAIAAAASLVACATVKRDYSAFYAHEPRSILVVPVLNDTTELTAPSVFATTVAAPLAERGYYVFPIHLSETLLRDLGLPEAGQIHQLPASRFAELFGADAVLFATIRDWSTKYLVIQSSTTVRIHYLLRDTRSGEVLWEHEQVASQDSGQSSDPIAALIAALITFVVQEMTQANFGPLATQANVLAFTTPGTGLPAGARHPAHGTDRDRF